MDAAGFPMGPNTIDITGRLRSRRGRPTARPVFRRTPEGLRSAPRPARKPVPEGGLVQRGTNTVRTDRVLLRDRTLSGKARCVSRRWDGQWFEPDSLGHTLPSSGGRRWLPDRLRRWPACQALAIGSRRSIPQQCPPACSNEPLRPGRRSARRLSYLSYLTYLTYWTSGRVIGHTRARSV